jgi:hypothetical protein
MLAVEAMEQRQQRFQGHGWGPALAGIMPPWPTGRGGTALQTARRHPGRRWRSVRLGPDSLGAHAAMDWELARSLGSKALLAAAGALLLYWTISAVKLVLSARGINPLIKQFFTQVASGQIDGAYLLTTKNYRSHVNRSQFIRFLANLQLNKYNSIKSARPRLQEQHIILTVTLKAESKEELPLEFTFVKVDNAWRVDRIQKPAAA